MQSALIGYQRGGKRKRRIEVAENARQWPGGGCQRERRALEAERSNAYWPKESGAGAGELRSPTDRAVNRRAWTPATWRREAADAARRKQTDALQAQMKLRGRKKSKLMDAPSRRLIDIRRTAPRPPPPVERRAAAQCARPAGAQTRQAAASRNPVSSRRAR